MRIVPHKFYECTWPGSPEFATHNAILDTTPYGPEVMFLGTFNPAENGKGNPADFFYGRNWFWPVMFNIFVHLTNNLISRRDDLGPIPPGTPTLDEIFKFCSDKKLTFADMVGSVIAPADCDLISDRNIGLRAMADPNNVQWNTDHIVEYLVRTKSIKTVYLTKKRDRVAMHGRPRADNIFTVKYLEIQQLVQQIRQDIQFRYIFTPSAQGLCGIPRSTALANNWVNEDGDHGFLGDWLDGHDCGNLEWTNDFHFQ